MFITSCTVLKEMFFLGVGEKRVLFEVGGGSECMARSIDLSQEKEKAQCDVACTIGNALASVLESVSTSVEANPVALNIARLGVQWTAEELAVLTSLLGASGYLSVQALGRDSNKFQFFKGKSCLNPIQLPPNIEAKILQSPTLKDFVRKVPKTRSRDARNFSRPHILGNKPLKKSHGTEFVPPKRENATVRSVPGNQLQGKENVRVFPKMKMKNEVVSLISEKVHVTIEDENKDNEFVCSALERENMFVDIEHNHIDIVTAQNGEKYLLRSNTSSYEKPVAVNLKTKEVFLYSRLPNGTLHLNRMYEMKPDEHGNAVPRRIHYDRLNKVVSFKKAQILNKYGLSGVEFFEKNIAKYLEE